jgi:vacuolar-type H+-ATPase subunit I/STV1
MTPDREKEIRELGNGNEFALFDAKEELLAEIDELRAEIDSAKHKSRLMSAEEYDRMLAEIERLREDREGFRNGQIQTQNLLIHALDDKLWIQAKLALAVEQINTLADQVDEKLRSIMVGNYSYLVNSYRSQIAAVFEEALSKIRGEK